MTTCPDCLGSGLKWTLRPNADSPGGSICVPCTYPGCRGGIIHCCEGDQEQEGESDEHG